MEVASGQIGGGIDGLVGGLPRMDELMEQAEQCAGWVLPLILQHSHEVAHQGLIGRTVSNLIKFYGSRGRGLSSTEPVRTRFIAALEVEARER